MSIETFVELAKNTINPIKCDWDAGTKVECNAMLGSWKLLRMHLKVVHCHKIKNNYLCHLPRCNNSLQPSQPALIDHIESAHLLRAVFYCPLHDCSTSSLKGVDALIKHYQDKHKDLDGKTLPGTSCKSSWKPVSWRKPLLNEPSDNIHSMQQKPLSFPPKVIQPGAILTGNITLKWPRSLKVAETSGSSAIVVDEASQTSSIWEPEASQQSQFISPGPDNIVTKRKKRAKQLEKAMVKEKRVEEEEEGIPKTYLDDLMGFPVISENGDVVDGNNLGFDGLARGWTGKGGSFLVGLVRGKEEEITMKKWVDKNAIFGKRLDSCKVDLAKPEPMMSREDISRLGGVGIGDSGASSYFGPWDDKFAGDWESARGPRSILFDVWQKRVDEIDRRREKEEEAEVENMVV